MATYIEAKGLWKARRRGPNGSRTSYYAETEAEAEAKADAATARPAAPPPVFTLAPGSVDQFVADHVAPIKRNQAKSTQTQWGWAMDKYILPVVGGLHTSALTVGHVQAVMDQLAGEPADTARAVRKHLFQLFRLLARHGLVPYNYVEEVKVEDPPQRRKPALSIVQARDLYRRTTVPAVRLMVGLGAFAGLAREEMREQTAARLKTGYVKVEKSAKRLRGEAQYRRRSVPVPIVAARLAPPTGDLWRDVGVDWMGDLLAKECLRLGLPVSNVHQLRATFASSLDMIGCPRSVSVALLGHSPKNVTDGYMTPDEDALVAWVERLWRYAKDETLKARRLQKKSETAVNPVDPRRRVYSRPA